MNKCTAQILHLWFGNIKEQGAERLKEPEDQDACYMIESSIYDQDLEARKSQQYGCLSKTNMIAMAADMPA